MGQLTETARQCLVSQGLVAGGISVLTSLLLIFSGAVVIVRAGEILHFTSLIHLAILQLVCGITSLVVVVLVWFSVAGYRSKEREVRAKYLDGKLSKELVALIGPVFLNYSAFLVSVVFLIIKSETTTRHELKNAMSHYMSCTTDKTFIDRLQMTLECCGSQSIIDWFLIDWQNQENRNLSGAQSNANQFEWDSVPFSCCHLHGTPPCIHYKLRTFGVNSLYDEGCADKLDRSIRTFIVTALISFLLSSLTMSFIMFSARKLQTSARSAISKGDPQATGSWYLLTPPAGPETYKPEGQPLLSERCPDTEIEPFHREYRSTDPGAEQICMTYYNMETAGQLWPCSNWTESVINEGFDARDSLSTLIEPESPGESQMKTTNDVCYSVSESTYTTNSEVCNYDADSIHSLSDTAVDDLSAWKNSKTGRPKR